MNTYDEQLATELRSRASDATGPGVTLDDVKRAAHRLRWQRRAMVGAVAAVILAVAVPVGLSGTIGADRSEIAPQPSPSPYPTEPQHVVLRTDVTERSGEPEVPYLFDGAINLPSGDLVPVSGSYDGLAAFGDGWVMTGSGDSGDRFVRFLDASGAEVATYPSGGTIELSPDGSLLSYFDTDDDALIVVGSDGLPGLAMPTNGESEVEPAAVFGSETCAQTEGPDGCSVWFNDRNTGTSSVSTSGGTLGDTGFRFVYGNRADGAVTGVISVDDFGSCSRMRGPSGDPTWETCDYTLGEFSPDGRMVLGYPAYRDGFGDGLVAILDADTGDLLAEFKNNRKSQASITNVIWETDTSLLATVYQKGQWSLMRMTVYGELTKVTDFPGDDMSPGLVLPVVP